jgi:hypothetical protein
MSATQQLLTDKLRRENAAAMAAGTYRAPPEIIASNRETALGRFLEKTGKTLIMGAGLTLVTTAALATYVGVMGGAWAGMLYADGMLHPKAYHSTYAGQYGAQHAKAISKAIEGLKVTVETSLETMTAKVFVQDVAQKAPSLEEIGSAKSAVNDRLAELQQKAAGMKKTQELELQGTFYETYLPKK